MPDDMSLLIKPEDVLRLQNSEQACNFIGHKIEEWQNWALKQPGPPTNELTSLEYLTWERRLMIAYGEVIGAMQALQAFQIITINEFKAFKKRIIAAATRKAAAVQMGVDP